MSVTDQRLPGAADDDAVLQQARWRIGAIVVVAVVLLAAGLVVSRMRAQGDPVYAELAGDVSMPAVVLTDTEGDPYDLRGETAGRYTLLFFGYTSCPDACPIQMAVLGRAFQDLPGSVREELTVVFVTTDPARDTPAAIRSYLDQFEPTFVGLTGDAVQLRDLQFAAGVPAATTDPAGADGDYLVGHATQVLLFDSDGVARRAYPLGVRQTEWVADLEALVGGDGA